MKHLMRGFGVRLTESQARALMFHPAVEQVEEDGYVYLSAPAQAFDFASTMRASFTPGIDSTSACPWNTGGYYACTWTDDSRWWLDRIDNSGLLNRSRPMPTTAWVLASAHTWSTVAYGPDISSSIRAWRSEPT